MIQVLSTSLVLLLCWANASISDEYHSYPMTITCIAVFSLALMSLYPYFVYLLGLLDPERIVRSMMESAKRGLAEIATGKNPKKVSRRY